MPSLANRTDSAPLARAEDGRPNAPPPPAPSWQAWLGPMLIALAMLIMLLWGWGKWADVLVDFGKELYISWRLACGEVLYRDVAHIHGPLSPYVTSLLFVIFGVGIRTLVVANIVIVAAFIWLLYALMRELGGRFSATVACLVFVTLFAFRQLTPFSICNYVCPKAHGVVHGLMLDLLAMYFLLRYHRRARLTWLAAAGLAAGCAFLTHAEAFLPVAVALPLGVGLTLWLRRERATRAISAVGVLFAAAVVPPLAAFGLLCTAMPAGQALGGTLGTWPGVFAGQAVSLKLKQMVMGTDDVPGNLGRMLAWTGWYALVLVPPAVLGLVRMPRRLAMLIAAALFVATSLGLWAAWEQIAWADTARPLPLLMAAAALVLLVAVLRSARDPSGGLPLVFKLAMTVMALVTTAKMLLNVRISYLGFTLAMPATLMLVTALLSWVPALLGRRGRGTCFAAVGLALVVVGVAVRLLPAGQIHDPRWRAVRYWFRHKTARVGSGADEFLATNFDFFPRGKVTGQAAAYIGRRLQPNETLAALPEGVMLNYLARRRSSIRYINFMPTEFALFGEQVILQAFKDSPPDYVAIVHKDTWEFGYTFFGTDYGRELYAWICKNYRPVRRFGQPPLQRRHQFGILLLERSRPPR